MALVQDEDEEENVEENECEKVSEEMVLVVEGVHCEEVVLLTVSWSVLVVHHHLVLL